jgi:hypothetical protein
MGSSGNATLKDFVSARCGKTQGKFVIRLWGEYLIHGRKIAWFSEQR